MSNKNPYTGEYYRPLFEFMRKKKVYTRAELLAEAVRLGMSDKVRKGAKSGQSPADCTVTVMLSPRDEKQEGLRGDPRGNLSARGEVYFNELLNREVGDKQRFRLRWRTKVLARRSRNAPEVKQEKKRKVSKPTKKVVKPTKKVVKVEQEKQEIAPITPPVVAQAEQTEQTAQEVAPITE